MCICLNCLACAAEYRLAVVAWLVHVAFSVLSASSLWKFSSTLCCVSVPCQETGVNAITYEMGLMWLLGPALGGAAMRIHVALISVSSQTQLSGEGEERSSVSIICSEWASQPEVFLIFIPPEERFNLTRRVYVERWAAFFRSAAWIRNQDLAFVTLSCCNFKDGPTVVQSQCCLLILIARF